MSEDADRTGLDGRFIRRVLFVALVAALAWLIWRLSGVLLLVFGAVLVAVLLRSLADPIARATPLGQGLSLAAAGLIIAGVLAGAGWLFGAQIAAQVAVLGEALPRAWTFFETQVLRLPGGEALVERMEELQEEGAAMLANVDTGVISRVTGFVQSAVGAIAELLVVIVAGIYLSVRPQRYRDGVLVLAPQQARDRVARAVDAAGMGLRRWLLGTLAAMVAVGTLVGLGAWAIGLPSPLALGLIAGLAEFIPIVGPVAAAIPGILLGLTMGPETALWALLLYFGVQQLESIVITPLAQRQAVELPSIITLFSVLSFGLLFGPLGVVLATPLAVVSFILVKSLYVRDVLGEAVELPGDGQEEEEEGS